MDDLTLFDRFVQSLEKDYENFDDKATLLKNLQEVSFTYARHAVIIAELYISLKYTVIRSAALSSGL